MTTSPKPAPPGDRLFALIASIPGSGSVDWCDRVRALLDEVRAEAVAPTADPATETPTITPDPDRDGVILHLPEITYLDTQVWAADVGLTRKALAALAAVLPASVDRTAVLREAAETLGRMDYDTDSNDYGYDTYRDAWNGGVMDGADLLRRMADEAQPTQARAAEDPARIDRLRPEFTEHSSVEAIDVQLKRARAQERRWHLRAEWLVSLRADRVAQKARGEWPADQPSAGPGVAARADEEV